MNGINNHPGYCLESIPQPVDTLSTGAKAEWKRLAPTIFKLQTARPADLRSLELLCEILADITVLQQTIRTDGILIKTGTNSQKCHPAQKSLEAARRQAHRLLDQFGCIPGSKAKRAQKFNAYTHKMRYGEQT